MKEPKDNRIRSLRNRIRKLEVERDELKQKNKKLLSEIKSLEHYKEVTSQYIEKELDGVPVEEVVRKVALGHKYGKIKEERKKASKESEEEREKTRLKFAQRFSASYKEEKRQETGGSAKQELEEQD